MSNVKKMSVALGILASLAVLVHGCGSGGGGGGGGAPAGTAAQSASAASKAIVSALGVATSGSEVAAKPSFKEKTTVSLSDPSQIRQALHDFKVSMSKLRQKTLYTVIDSGDRACPDGGTRRIQLNDKNTPNDKTDDSWTDTFNNCTEVKDNVNFVRNGTVNVFLTENGFTMRFSDYVVHVSDSSNALQVTQNGILSFSGSQVKCGDEEFLENGTLTMDHRRTTQFDRGNNGTFEVNETSDLDNFRLTIAQTHESAACTLDATTFAVNGRAAFTNHVNAAESLRATFTTFTMMMTPAERMIDSILVEGGDLSINGTIAVSSDCVNGTFTINTPAGAEPFIPVDGSCPVDGKFLVNRGGTTTSVTFTSTGAVQINEGDDNLIEVILLDCEAAEACI